MLTIGKLGASSGSFGSAGCDPESIRTLMRCWSSARLALADYGERVMSEFGAHAFELKTMEP